jgi:hypothetical protein
MVAARLGAGVAGVKIEINTSPTDVAPIEQEQRAKFDGEKWALFGEVIEAVRQGRDRARMS